ncbi:replication-relaxation family protein [Streptomyces rubiginosohelvolus]|uniref:replication-relaxation family protein n=1 Tax=Streptomyces rubiginosohelvolus TaxID=67362 RepID=UPI0036DB15D7
MRKHGLSENGGSTDTGDTLRNLTPKGLEAASWELRRPATEMGSTARGAGSSGASHPMAVNETVIALLRPKPDLAKLADDPPHIQAAAQAAVDGPSGIGTIGSYWTEVPLPATGTWNAPGKGGAQADLVLTAPQDQVPLLFIEVENCHETAEELAAKLEKYARFFRRTVKDTDGKERPMWCTCWAVPEHEYGEMPHPPVLLVFNRIGERSPNRTIPRLEELTRHLWKGQWLPEGYHSYDRKIPIVAVGLRSLREHGPQGPVFFRFGRDRPQSLLDAIGNPRLAAVRAREREKARVRQAEYQAQLREIAREQAAKKAVEAAREAAQREARRPSCAGCGNRFTDERWEAAEETDWGRLVDPHPHLCDDCKAVTVASAAPMPGRQEEHQEPLPEWARQEFMRFPHRPRCTECKAAFTDERWKAVERTGWHPLGQENIRRCARPALRSTRTASRTRGQRGAPTSPRRSGRSRSRCPSRSPAGGFHACAPDPMRGQALRNLQGRRTVSRGVTISLLPAGPPDDVPYELWEGEEEALAAAAAGFRGRSGAAPFDG